MSNLFRDAQFRKDPVTCLIGLVGENVSVVASRPASSNRSFIMQTLSFSAPAAPAVARTQGKASRCQPATFNGFRKVNQVAAKAATPAIRAPKRTSLVTKAVAIDPSTELNIADNVTELIGN